MLIRAYLRASTTEQDANRAKNELREFITSFNKRIAGYYIENQSGTKLERPELNKLIEDSETGDVVLIEKMDRLTRLPWGEWKTLKARIMAKGLVIVVVDQPMTHAVFSSGEQNSITLALTEFMLDLGAAMARDDYETRHKRQAQGIAKAKAEGKYRGRQPNVALHHDILDQLTLGRSYSQIQEKLGCSRATIAKVVKQQI
ncbi:recombinase family protein [Photobacterium carnosum]|uniref:Resolvase n=1 Tax=Photobacterium iliopiscarium TaxID=56192 RepID=A0A2T3M7S1_9GAMM|nr:MULTISPECIES: recombinase family protein [Photobacterium]MBY3790031.1 recombinase family protein [Photobacterium carnosum]MCD9517007.1 resolvase [Photobacterium carnosum]MCD9535733.1 resolvase [Photobacterium carnosum]PSV88312.1 resolvase [Photobacterium iliopiscarium]